MNGDTIEAVGQWLEDESEKLPSDLSTGITKSNQMVLFALKQTRKEILIAIKDESNERGRLSKIVEKHDEILIGKKPDGSDGHASRFPKIEGKVYRAEKAFIRAIWIIVSAVLGGAALWALRHFIPI